VREVEEALGTGLFERQPRRIGLTNAGRLFVREAKRSLEQSRRTVSLVRAFAKQEIQPLSIGISSLSAPVYFQTAIEQARKTIPVISIAVGTANTPELIRDLLRGDLDLAIVDLPVRERGLRVRLLFSEALVAVLSEKFSTSQQTTIQLSALRNMPMVLLSQTVDPARIVINQALSSAGNRAFKIHDARSVPDLFDQVAIANRVGLLRQSATRFQRQGVVCRSLAEPIQAGCAFAWRNGQRGSIIASFRDEFIHFFQQSWHP
jgi:DNA-binding transcriptional LysR family regulator